MYTWDIFIFPSSSDIVCVVSAVHFLRQVKVSCLFTSIIFIWLLSWVAKHMAFKATNCIEYLYTYITIIVFHTFVLMCGTTRLRESFSTNITFVWLLTSELIYVPLDNLTGGECFSPVWINIWPFRWLNWVNAFPQVSHLCSFSPVFKCYMFLQIARLSKCFPTEITFVWHLTSVT